MNNDDRRIGAGLFRKYIDPQQFPGLCRFLSGEEKSFEPTERDLAEINQLAATLGVMSDYARLLKLLFKHASETQTPVRPEKFI